MLDTLKMLKPPINALETAKNFLKAFDIERHAVIDTHFLDLYAKQYRESSLAAADEQEVLRMYATHFGLYRFSLCERLRVLVIFIADAMQ